MQRDDALRSLEAATLRISSGVAQVSVRSWLCAIASIAA